MLLTSGFFACRHICRKIPVVWSLSFRHSGGNLKKRRLIMNEAECWNAVRERNAEFDGRFWFGVVTTGVYCKPSCTSRPAKRENVRFYSTVEAAQRDGLRACKRCKPDAATASQDTLTKLLEICRYIEKRPTEQHSLSALGKRAELSQFQLHRLFKSFLQLTPKEYCEQIRLRALKRNLRAASSVTDAIYDSGFESSSVIYGRLDAHLGMTPRKYRRGGQSVEISFAFGQTALGKVLIGATNRGICYLQFGDSERELLEQLAVEYPKATVTPSATAAGDQFQHWMTA